MYRRCGGILAAAAWLSWCLLQQAAPVTVLTGSADSTDQLPHKIERAQAPAGTVPSQLRWWGPAQGTHRAVTHQSWLC